MVGIKVSFAGIYIFFGNVQILVLSFENWNWDCYKDYTKERNIMPKFLLGEFIRHQWHQLEEK